MNKRDIDEILSNPQENDIVDSRYLGFSANQNRIWQSCPSCGKYRWVTKSCAGMYSSDGTKRYCKECSQKYKFLKQPVIYKYSPDAIGKYKTIRIDDIPKAGDIILGGEINHSKRAIYRWSACPNCGEYRWVHKDYSLKHTCIHCMGKGVSKRIGEVASNWKGGRIVNSKGYVKVILRSDSPYYIMVEHDGYIFEHRLIMAQLLGRCLEKSEIVHHKHTKYPQCSKEDKSDNRPENLEIIKGKDSHNIITLLEKDVKKLKEQVIILNEKLRLSEWRIRELESIQKEEKQI